MPRLKIVAVDLDGTLLKYDDIDKPLGDPIPGIAEELGAVKAMGWTIIIWTVRSNVEEIRTHLNKHGIPFDYINENPWQPPDGSQKIAADVYLDDRAIHFNGETSGLAQKICNFKPWYKEPSWMR
jgi:hypothetical protein